jgi:hypothetical protein
MNGVWISKNRASTAVILFLLLATALASQTACGKELPDTEVAIETADPEPLPSSVLEDSYGYHRLGTLTGNTPRPVTSPARVGGWYRYGFGVQAHRWGWFGAEHYYPRVLWHRGYYGDRCRWCYRRGY